MARTFGLLISGFAVKLYAIVAALYVANFVADYIGNAFGAINALPL